MLLKYPILIILISLSHTLHAADDLFEQSLEDILNIESELKADVGTRSGARNFLDSFSPVDVVTFKQIETSGLTSLTDVLRYFVPGFNAPEASVADGSDHVRAFTLRGMSPDQVLVLVNGKRLHNSALLHVNGVIGRGSNGVDLDSILLGSIEKIEILRDGAAAQYGSDAISGVINIILKGAGHTNHMTANTSKFSGGDGEQYYLEAFTTFPLRYDGFANFSIAAKHQNQTQRAGYDRRLDPPSIETHYGVPDSDNFLASYNTEIAQKSDITFYSQGLFNYRDSEASAFFRTPDTNRPIFPEGFLPLINARVDNYSLTAGVKGEFENNIKWDLSNTLGYNKFHFFVNDSMNYSLAASSPTSFDNGSLSFIQNSINLDLKKQIHQFDLAGGLEYRYENYEIQSGEMASYTGTASQGFAGFAPDNEVDENRNSYAIYADATHHFTDNLSLEGALRYEDYSDFGSTTNFKLAFGYKIIPELLLRSSTSTGFRAPSLAQSTYSQTSSFTDNSTGLLSSQGTFRVDHEVSQILGAEDLKPEQSQHFTIGSVYQPNKEISLMVDYFYTFVNDRIMLSNELRGTTAHQQEVLTAHNVSLARFLTNAVNTQTHGIDVKFNYKHLFDNNSSLDLSLWYSYNRNKITDYNNDKITLENSFEQIDRVENGQPKSSARILSRYQRDKLAFTLNLSRHGSYSQVINNQSYKFKAAWLTDVDVSYQIGKNIHLAIGGHNIFDVRPNKWDNLSGIGFGSDGIIPYSLYSPFGYSGASYYLRASMDF